MVNWAQLGRVFNSDAYNSYVTRGEENVSRVQKEQFVQKFS